MAARRPRLSFLPKDIEMGGVKRGSGMNGVTMERERERIGNINAKGWINKLFVADMMNFPSHTVQGRRGKTEKQQPFLNVPISAEHTPITSDIKSALRD